MKIAFLSYTYGTNGIHVPEDWLVNRLDENLIKSDIAKAKALEPDFIVVMPHMGNEYEEYVRDTFKNTAHMMLNAGADIVVASHPHVLQPMETVELTEENGEKKFRAAQIWEWLYRKRVQSFEEMTNLSKDLIAKLNDQFVVNPLKQRIVQESADGTVKYLFELPDGMLIETVLMRQHYGLSVCVTTQVGCNIGCTFCASGLIKKQRDLNNGEIVSQIMLVQKYFDERGQDERVSHIVVMGIGEPFDNYNNVLKFIRTVNDDKGLAIGARHITVSTSGLAHKIRDFANEGEQVYLAVSLHAPNNDLRSSIMKINRDIPN